MYVLVIDTSSPAVTTGVVLVESVGDRTEISVAAQRAPLAARGHGELLSPAIAECLTDAGLAARDLDAVVVGVGPGPFTGLRVGIVTAEAFADAAGLRLVGVCSLDALGLACADEASLLVATDARRREVYWARYEHGVRIGDPAVGRPDELALTGVTAVAGAGGELYQDVWPHLPRRSERYPDPVSLVGLALDRLVDGSPSGPIGPIEPMYLRRPDAVVPGAPKTVTR